MVASCVLTEEQNKDLMTVDKEIILMRHGQPDLVMASRIWSWLARFQRSI
jgi:hypothetical protein